MSLDSLLLAQSDGNAQFVMILGVIAMFVAIVFFATIILIVKQYKRCPSNRVLVIYGGRRLGARDSPAAGLRLSELGAHPD